jgi:hypothetical protein
LAEEQTPKRINLADAQKALEAAQQQRMRECWREIDEVLKKHNFALTAVPSISAEGRIVARPRLVDARG